MKPRKLSTNLITLIITLPTLLLLWVGASLIKNGLISTEYEHIFRGVLTEGFPLQQKWISNLDSDVAALSTDGSQIIFARTNKTLYALKSQDGQVLWKQDLAWQALPDPPIGASGYIYLADGIMIWAFDQKTGTVIWKQPVPLSVAKVRSASDRFIAVEIEPYIYILDARNGETIWSKADCSYGGIQAYIDYLNVFIPCTGQDIGRIRAIDIPSGKISWEIQTPYRIASVAYQDGKMYYSPDRNTITAFHLQNRKVVWENTFDGDGYRTFKVLEGYLSAAGSNKFCLYQLETGEKVWCAELSGPQNAVLSGDLLFVFNGRQNNIVAYEHESGKIVGRLIFKGLKLFTAQKEIMVTIDDAVVFGNRSTVYAYGK